MDGVGQLGVAMERRVGLLALLLAYKEAVSFENNAESFPVQGSPTRDRMWH